MLSRRSLGTGDGAIWVDESVLAWVLAGRLATSMAISSRLETTLPVTVQTRSGPDAVP